MVIELSTITFTNESDVVPPFGVEQIFVSTTVNTLAGDDIINGGNNDEIPNGYVYGLLNYANLNTNDGNDIITGIAIFGNGINNVDSPDISGIATINTGDGNDTITGISFFGDGIYNVRSNIDTGDGNDIITGIGNNFGILTEVTTIDTGNGDDIITAIGGSTGIDSRVNTTINTGDGNDIITATGDSGWGILLLSGRIDTGEGNDIITGTGDAGGLVFSTADFSYLESRIDTGEGDDIIIGTSDGGWGIVNGGTVNTGNGKDSIISHGQLGNSKMFLGDGDDSIIANIGFPGRAIWNSQMIDTGYGNDTITTTGVIYNQGVIDTGNGEDSIIANEGFESGLNSSGVWFLGEGEDYIKGFGSGDFYGGNGNDTLELTPGTYTVGIGGEGGESPIFTKGNQLMITSEFEKLIAGSTIYDFTSLTAGQIIVVA